jgi:hypothetical protein
LNDLNDWNGLNGKQLRMRRVGALADHDHTVLMEDHELAAVGFL